MAINRLNKKGYFFSLMVIMALLIVSVYFAAFTNPGQSRDASVSSLRINEINRFLTALEEDAKTGISVASLRTLLAFEERVQSSSSFISPDEYGASTLNELAMELMINGTLGGVDHPLVEDSNMGIWAKNMEEFGYLDVDLDFTNLRAGLYQDDPWHVKAFFEFNIFARDNFTDSTWNKPVRVEAVHNITKFEDPVYTVGTLGSYRQSFKMPIPNVNFPDDLAAHVSGKNYINSMDAPSFLNRIVGDMSASEFGVESLVYVPDLPAAYQREKSMVDRIYFSTNNPQWCNANQQQDVTAPEWVIIDADNAPTYGFGCP